MRICITGAGGSIGSALAERIYRKQHKDLVLIDQDETAIFYLQGVLREADCLVGDITNKKRMESLFKSFKPQVVYHCAAYKHVPVMEKQKAEAIANNIYGTKNVIDLSIRHKVKRFVFISTDKAAEPISVMGKTKRICEQMCCAQQSKTKFTIVRFGNVLSSRGSVSEIFRERISQGKSIEITHPEMERYFIKMQDALTLILEAAKNGKDKELMVWDMGDPIKIVDLAKSIMKEERKRVKIKFTKPRPGEKMREELFNEGEHPKKKGKILRVQFPYKEISLSQEIKKI